MEIIGLVFGYILIWFVGAAVIGGGWILFFLLRMKVSLRDSFVKWTVIIFEIFWLLAFLVYVFFPGFYSNW
ncbi:MAG: hypothetical protein IJJ66_03855 [Treponema sp.]|nr:hypothetical protein [Treponema sp.]